jgi:hypothetical protein
MLGIVVEKVNHSSGTSGSVAAEPGLAHGVAEAFSAVFLGQAMAGVLLLVAVLLAGQGSADGAASAAAAPVPGMPERGHAAAGE